MEFLQDVGSWILGALFVVLAAFLLVESGVGGLLALLLGWISGSIPGESAKSSEWRSRAEVRSVFQRDPETRALRGKITAQGEIWSAVWVDDSVSPPGVGSEVAIVKIEGLVAHVGPVLVA